MNASDINPDFAAQALAFKAEWPESNPRYLRTELPPPPDLPLDDLLPLHLAKWLRNAAEAKASPLDYVLAALLAVTGTLVGNNRRASPWNSWSEPPVIWAVAIGYPSMSKSSGLDAVLIPLKRAERTLRKTAAAELTDWRGRAQVAKLVESAWKDDVNAAIKDGIDPPARPASANPGPQPLMPSLAVSDITVEKLAVIIAGQPRGMLLARDKLAGWR